MPGLEDILQNKLLSGFLFYLLNIKGGIKLYKILNIVIFCYIVHAQQC